VVSLRVAGDADRDRVLRWRNHPRVRAVSLTSRLIEPDEHALWWRIVMADPDRRLLIYNHDLVPAGVVLFSRDGGRVDDAATWSFYLDVDGLDRRGELLPAWATLERESIEYAFEQLGVDRITGDVLASNTAVLALHRRFGFRVVDSDERDVDGEPTVVLRVELGLADRAALRG
jgi:UDP-4-amino-4,6-dideoxy-N-acetyl-beta-L-altrosamine N-acetyltransferase